MIGFGLPVSHSLLPNWQNQLLILFIGPNKNRLHLGADGFPKLVAVSMSHQAQVRINGTSQAKKSLVLERLRTFLPLRDLAPELIDSAFSGIAAIGLVEISDKINSLIEPANSFFEWVQLEF